MDAKQQALNNKQKERHDRGQDFQNEIKNSWRHVPHIWTMPIADGRGGSRAADRLTIAPKVNLLLELKRTAKKAFELSFLRPNQIRGLIDFDQVIERNYGIVLVSFLDKNKGVDEVYAIRLTVALRYMQEHNTTSIKLERLRKGLIVGATTQGAILLPKLNTQETAYDLKELVECYKYF